MGLNLRAEMVKISAALKHFDGAPSRNSRILEDLLEKCRAQVHKQSTSCL